VRIATAGGTVDVLWYRVDGLAMGALIALWVRSTQYSTKRTLYGSLAAILAAGILLIVDLHSHTTSFGMRITEADLVFGAAIASAVALAGSGQLGWLRSAPARFIADTSFCAYLIHVPLIDFAKLLGIGMQTTNPFVADALQAVFVIPATFGIAALSRKFLELPFLKLKDRFTSSSRAVPPLSPVAVAQPLQ
jgi:peptidoglycan/LPS O-acetylase OafA/YrhL